MGAGATVDWVARIVRFQLLSIEMAIYSSLLYCSCRERFTTQLRGVTVPDLAWYVGRAAAMSPREIIWRTRRAGDTLVCRDRSYEQIDSRMLARSTQDWDALSQGFRDGIARPVLLDQGRASGIAVEYPAEVEALIAEAERLRAGERAYFGYPSANSVPSSTGTTTRLATIGGRLSPAAG